VFAEPRGGIRVLTPEVAAKIAAGEVVERPASVVKELVENSLDAGARRISVEVEGGGVRLIRVRDDGAGIPASEVELAFQRHATSKIASEEDIEQLTTLGFRGEALPSIAAVADVEMLTRIEGDAAGIRLQLRDGVVLTLATEGAPRGTTVVVRNLFRTVPARLKFLRAPATENARIAEVLTSHALAYAAVQFTLLIDGRLALRTGGGGRVEDALVGALGVETAARLLPLQRAEPQGTVSVSGHVSPPDLTRSQRSQQLFFVNGRWVESRVLARALEQAYQGLLPAGRHPLAVVFVTLPAGDVDVNVHPTKREVRFRRDGEVFAVVQAAVGRTLRETAPAPLVTTIACDALGEQIPLGERMPEGEASSDSADAPARAPMALRLPVLRVLGQVGGTYIVAEGPDGVYLIDQHAAHERVLYERARAQQEKDSPAMQGLVEPVVVELSPERTVLLEDGREALEGLGFQVEPFGGSAYMLRAVPSALAGRDYRMVLDDLLDRLAEEPGDDWRDRVAKALACRGAIKAGQGLTSEEMLELVRQLEATASPQTCPHGRPTMVHLSASQLQRHFGRA